MGKVKGLIYVIEFQKWGVPHAHILAILNREGLIMQMKLKSIQLLKFLTKYRIYNFGLKS